jgi:hypothetical protein
MSVGRLVCIQSIYEHENSFKVGDYYVAANLTALINR